MSKNVIIIMAGGLGKRMNSDLPKVLHKMNGTPLLLNVVQEAMLLNPIKILTLAASIIRLSFHGESYKLTTIGQIIIKRKNEPQHQRKEQIVQRPVPQAAIG